MPPRIEHRSAAATRLIHGLFAALLVSLAAAGCAGSATTDAAPQDAAKACAQQALRPGGECCPTGTYYDFKLDDCLGVGPPECADLVAANPQDCRPRWCADADGADARVCTPAELKTGVGCPAGEAHSTVDPGVCVAAGHFPGSGMPAHWGENDGPLPIPDDASAPWPALAELAELAASTPWPNGCPPGFVVSGDRCIPDPSACGDDPYGDAKLTDAGTIFANASLGSDANPGTRDKPKKTLAKALTAAKPDKIVALADGSYLAGLVIENQHVDLRGRCAAKVTIAGISGTHALLVSERLDVRGVHFSGPGAGVAIIAKGGGRIADTWMTGIAGDAVIAQTGYGELHIERTVIEDTLRDEQQQDSAAIVTRYTDISLTDVLVSRVWARGVFLDYETVGVAKRLLIRSVRTPDASLGRGLLVYGASELTLHDSRVSSTVAAAIEVHGAGSVLSAVGVTIDKMRAGANKKQTGGALNVHDGGAATLVNSRITDSDVVGVYCKGAGTNVTLLNTVIDHIAPDAAGSLGIGVWARDGATVALIDTRVSDTRSVGVGGIGAGTTVILNRALIDATRVRLSDGAFGVGLMVSDGAHATATDVRIVGGDNFGAVVEQKGSELTADRLLIDHQRSVAGGAVGARAGLLVTSRAEELGGPRATVRSGRISASTGDGVIVDGEGSRVSFTGVLVDSVVAEAPDPAHPDVTRGSGIGIVAQGGVDLQLVGVAIRAAATAGVYARYKTFYAKGSNVPTVDGAGKLRAIGLLVADTRPDGVGRHGVGVWCEAIALCALISSRIAGTRVAAFSTNRTSTSVVNSALVGTSAGHLDADGAATAADGLAVQGGILTLDTSVIAANSRVGLVVAAGARTTASRSLITGNEVGVTSFGGGLLTQQKTLVWSNTVQGSTASIALPSPPATVDVSGQAPVIED